MGFDCLKTTNSTTNGREGKREEGMTGRSETLHLLGRKDAKRKEVRRLVAPSWRGI